MNFGNPTNDKFAYVPELKDQQTDATAQMNKRVITWRGEPITLNGTTYIYKQVGDMVKELYDLESYKNALDNPEVVPLQKGTLTTLANGNLKFEAI